MMNKVEYINLQ